MDRIRISVSHRLGINHPVIPVHPVKVLQTFGPQPKADPNANVQNDMR